MMIEEDLEIAFNRKVISTTFVMGLRSRHVVAAASPGQFVMIRVHSEMDPLLRRPFSICGVQGDDLFLVLYEVVGRGTAIMARKERGERLRVLGPLGKGFHYSKNGPLNLLVAGGIGVAPLLFLGQLLGGTSVRFMTGFRSASELIPVMQISDLPVEVSIATDDGTAGFSGLVTDLLEDYIKEHGAGSLSLFTCGPVAMLQKVAAIALNYNIPCQASLEGNMACGLGACQGCAVRAAPGGKRTYHHVCTDGPVFPVQAIDWDFFKTV